MAKSEPSAVNKLVASKGAPFRKDKPVATKEYHTHTHTQQLDAQRRSLVQPITTVLFKKPSYTSVTSEGSVTLIDCTATKPIVTYSVTSNGTPDYVNLNQLTSARGARGASRSTGRVASRSTGRATSGSTGPLVCGAPSFSLRPFECEMEWIR